MLSFDHSDRELYIHDLMSQDGWSYEESSNDYDSLYHQQWGDLELEDFDSEYNQEKHYLYENPDRLQICHCGKQAYVDCAEYCLQLNSHSFLREAHSHSDFNDDYPQL